MSLIKVKLVSVFLLFGLLGFSQVKRVISLTPSITENIYLIGAQDKLVGCTSYCTQAVKEGVEQIGSTIEVNVEKIFLLQPDLVLAMELTKPQDIASLKKLGIRVEIIYTPKNFDEICEQTLHIGILLGNSSKSQKVVALTKSSVAEIRKKSKDFDSSKIFFQIGANPIFTVLENTFMDDFIVFSNGENIAKGMKRGTITREAVLQKNPDIIVIASMGGFGETEKKIWESYKGLAAVKKNKVFLVPSETSCSPTPHNFAAALQDIYQNIQK